MIRRWGYLGAAVLIGLAAVVYGAGLDALLDPAVPVFGDLGGHIAPILELRSRLARGVIHDWSFSWYGGFPLFYFYFPLPSLTALALAAVVGIGRAITVVVVAGPLLLPLASAALVRATGGTKAGAALAAAGSGYFVLARSLTLSGGTLESSMVGEFSYAFAMAASLFYLATLPRLLERRTAGALVAPVLLLAATALSHVMATGLAVVGSLALARGRRDLAPLAGTWVAAFLVAGWWTVPFLAYAGEMSALAWAPPSPERVAALLYEGVPLAVLALLAVAWRSDRLGSAFYRLAGALVGVALLPLLFPEPPIYPTRLLPYAYWAGHVLAAVVAWQAIRAALARTHLVRVGVALVGVGALLGVGVLRGPPRRTADVMLRGDRLAVDAGSWRELEATVAGLPPGAVMAAGRFPDPDGPAAGPMYLLDLFGSRHLPRRAGHRVVGGLWQESSPNAPYKSLAALHLRSDLSSLLALFEARDPDVDLGVRQSRLLGARYVVIAGRPAYVRTLEPRGLRELARDTLWRLYEVEDHAVVLEPGPIAAVPRGDFRAAASRWFEAGGRADLPVVAAPGLPLERPAGRAVDPRPETAVALLPGEIRVSGVVPGRPLLLRLSYFPNWRLASPGRGPFRTAPNHMLVIPESDAVRLVWRTGWPERLGRVLTVLGILLLLGAGVVAGLGRRRG